MTFAELIEEIRYESRIKAGTDFQEILINLLNELFIEAVCSERPFELRTRAPLNATPTTGITALPADFLVHHEVLYQDINTGRQWPLYDIDDASQPSPIGLYGHPKSFEIITGNNLFVGPTTQIVTGDIISLLYYKQPLVITTSNLQTENPIVRLEPFLIRSAIRRARMFNTDDVQVAQMFEGDIASAANMFSKDQPEPMPPNQPAVP